MQKSTNCHSCCAALSENVKRQLRVHLLEMDAVLYRDAHGIIACHGYPTGSQSDPVKYDVKEKVRAYQTS